MCEVCENHPLMSRRALLAAVPFAAVAACATNPTTGRSQLILVDDSQMQQLALQAWQQERSQNRVWNNPAQQARLTRVGQRIAGVSGLTGQQWEFVLFDKPEKNAFVLPGGKVGFYRGLMEICDRDDHIATVLGHEVGHVSGRHAAERYSQGVAQQAGMQVAGAAVNNQMVMAALGLGLQVGVQLPFSRSQESEADRIGINYMHTAGYDVRQSITFWERMSAGGGSRPPALLSTHPDPAARIADIRAYINARGWGPV